MPPRRSWRPEADTPPIDPQLYNSPEVRHILAERDIDGLFRAVKATGISYRRIAALVGMSQSEVSEIISGRRGLFAVLSGLLSVRTCRRAWGW